MTCSRLKVNFSSTCHFFWTKFHNVLSIQIPGRVKVFLTLKCVSFSLKRLDSAIVRKHECCHATTLRRFSSPWRTVKSENFHLFRYFRPLCSFNIIFSYLGWLMSALQILTWHLRRCRSLLDNTEAFRQSGKITVNTVTFNTSCKVKILWPQNVLPGT